MAEQTSLPIVQLCGPLFYSGADIIGGNEKYLWTISLGAPEYGTKGRGATSADHLHPVRTLALEAKVDLDSNSKEEHRQRNAQLLSLHVIAGQDKGQYADTKGLFFETRLLNEADPQPNPVEEVKSYRGSGFRTEVKTNDRATGKNASFYHIVSRPIQAKAERLALEESEITMPVCQLVQGSIPVIFKDRETIKWARELALIGIDGTDQGPVRLVLTPDGIEMDLKVPFPAPNGTAVELDGRFLLYVASDGKLRIRLLRDHLDKWTPQWSKAWTDLRAGENTVAVEIHQESITSSDVSFDLELIGVQVAAAARLQIARFGVENILYWQDLTFHLESAGALGARCSSRCGIGRHCTGLG